MIAVILEIWPRHREREKLTTMAAVLRPAMDQVDGFISVERFESLTEQGKILVLSYWRDDASLNHWLQSRNYQQIETTVRSSVVNYHVGIVNRH